MNRTGATATGDAAAAMLVALCLATALIALLLLPVGQGVAGFYNGPWIWPNGHLPTAIAYLAAGRPGHGLPDGSPLPPTWQIYTAAAALQLLPVTAAVSLARLLWRHGRPATDRDGFASRRQARDVLGHARLYDGRSQVRPDLYPRNHPRPGDRPRRQSNPGRGVLGRTP